MSLFQYKSFHSATRSPLHLTIFHFLQLRDIIAFFSTAIDLGVYGYYNAK